MLLGAAAIFIVVIALAALAVYRDPAKRPSVRPGVFIVAGGVVLPVVALSALLAYGVSLTGALRAADGPQVLEIRVTAHQFWWEVLYPGMRAGEFIATANEIHIPAGRTVRITLSSRDVIHSFWVPNLAGKIDMIPGRTTQLALSADHPGRYRGQCAEFCGSAHALMAFEVVAIAEADFDRWLAALRQPARTPETSASMSGLEAFVAHGCGNCHAVRGVSEPQIAAPDLTHFGSRAFLGAGALPNTRQNRILWLAEGERVKPGRAMPSYAHVEHETLAAIADYLGTLQ